MKTKALKQQARKFFRETKVVNCPAFPKEKIRQIGDGKKHFWSVIPAWRRVRGKIVNAKGNLGKQ